MARLSRKGDILTVHVGKLEIARVVGMGGADPTLQIRQRHGFWRPIASIQGEHAEATLREYSDLIEWTLKQPTRDVEL